MKKVEANRYPHSATLFKFCKEALEIRYDGNVKVIDQDVGAILGYDPADCSHWKKGKKNIRSLSTLRNIADHLNVDEGLLIDITSGKVSLDEAVFEFRGYGSFMLNGKSLDVLKKEYFKNPSKYQANDGQVPTFEDLFDVQRNAVVRVAQELIKSGGFTEAPLYIPEILRLYTGISLIVRPEQEEASIITHEGEGIEFKTMMTCREDDTRPYVRFLAAKVLFKHLCMSQHPLLTGFSETPSEIMDIQSNIFAGALLVPGEMLRSEVEKSDTAFDLVRQLADTFWVSRSLINQRLRDFLEHGN